MIKTGQRLLLQSVAFIGAIAASSTVAALEADQLFAMLSPSVMVVQTYDADGLRLSLGSAVTIAPEKLVTNCHVLRKAKRIQIKQDNVTYEARLEHIDQERDMCQISARNFKAPAVKLADSNKLRVGQRVYALGNPEGLELTLSDGLISQLRREDDGTLFLIQTSAPITNGSSGGGLFDTEGRLIGVTTLSRKSEKEAQLNFAIPINWLRDLPARSAATIAKVEEKKRQDEDAERAARATPTAVAALPEKLLTPQELSEHFSTSWTVHASTSLAPSVTFTMSSGGTLEIVNTANKVAKSWGSYKIDYDNGQMCILIQRGNSLTANNAFQDLRGCYRLYRIGSKEFVLRSVQDNAYIRYSLANN